MGGVALALVIAAVAAVGVVGDAASGAPSPCKRVLLTASFSPDSKWVAVQRQRECDALSSLLVMRTDGRSRRTIGRNVLDWRWAPKGDRLAVEPVKNEASSFVVVTPSGRSLVRVADGTAFAWSPSGRELALRRRLGQDVVLVPLSGRVRPVAAAPLGNYRAGQALGWSPDGKTILFTTAGDGPNLSIRLVGRDGSGEHELARGRSPDWAPDGSRIVLDRGTPELPAWVTVRPDGGDLRSVGPGLNCTSAAWAPKAHWLSFRRYCTFGVDQERHTWVDAPTGGAVIDLGTGSPSWSPSGRRLALVRTDQSSVSLVDADGSDRVDLPFGGGVAWAPNGRRLAVGGGKVRLVGADGRGARVVGAGEAPVWSPNGRLIAFVRARSCGHDLYVLRLSPRKLRRLVRCG